jgi:hypothetical protein
MSRNAVKAVSLAGLLDVWDTYESVNSAEFGSFLLLHDAWLACQCLLPMVLEDFGISGS